MADLEAFHAEYGATFAEVGGRRVPADYGRPDPVGPRMTGSLFHAALDC